MRLGRFLLVSFGGYLNSSLGSSKGAREFLKSPLLKDFIDKNPQISFDFILRRGSHPYICSTYINGFEKSQSLRNMKPDEILNEFQRVRKSCTFFFNFLLYFCLQLGGSICLMQERRSTGSCNPFKASFPSLITSLLIIVKAAGNQICGKLILCMSLKKSK